MWKVTRLATCLLLLGVAQAGALSGVRAAGGASLGTPQSPVCNSQMTVCHWSETFGSPIADWADCPGFTVSADFLADRQYTQFYDGSGDPTRQLRHVSFTGTLTNTSTGAWVTYQGDFLREFDYATDTVRITGLSNRITLPSGGSMVIDAGLLVIDLATGDGVQHGPANDALICSVLS